LTLSKSNFNGGANTLYGARYLSSVSFCIEGPGTISSKKSASPLPSNLIGVAVHPILYASLKVEIIFCQDPAAA